MSKTSLFISPWARYSVVNVVGTSQASLEGELGSYLRLPKNRAPLSRDVRAFAPVPEIDSVSPGVIPPENFMEKPDAIGPSQEVMDLYNRMDPFSGKLRDVPPLGDITRQAVLEKNAIVVWGYIQQQYRKLFLDSSSRQLPVFLTTAPYKGVAAISEHTVALEKLPKILARGKTRGFMSAVSLRVQEKRDIDQQLPDIGITTEEANSIKNSLREIKAGLAYNAKTTQSSSYVFGVSPAQKQFDREVFQRWVDERNKGIVAIVRLTIADVPLGFASQEVLDFELDPTNVVCRNALKAKLQALQKQALSQYRDKPNRFNLNDFLSKY